MPKYVYATIAFVAFAIGFFVITFVGTIPRSDFNEELNEEICTFRGTSIEERVCTLRTNNAFRRPRVPCYVGLKELSYISDDGVQINGTVQITDANTARLDTVEEIQEAIGDLQPGDPVSCFITPDMEITTPMATAGFIAGSVILGLAMCCSCYICFWLILAETDIVDDVEDFGRRFAGSTKKGGEVRRPAEIEIEESNHKDFEDSSI